MKSAKLTAVAMAAAALAVLTGCATVVPVGLIYTGVKLPVSNATGSVSYNKTGQATSKSILGLVAWGDSSIKAAADEGKVVKINSIDYQADNLFGVYGKYTTIVYGEGETTNVPKPTPTVAPALSVPPPAPVVVKPVSTKKVENDILK